MTDHEKRIREAVASGETFSDNDLRALLADLDAMRGALEALVLNIDAGGATMGALADARAALSEAKAGGWQPIETAPKDGTRILVARIGATGGVQHLGIEATPVHVMWACVGYWSAKWNNWNDGFEPCGLAGPNYWQHLPPPPAIANQGAQDGR